jgi:hypothetical protein
LSTQRFNATVIEADDRAYIPIPFDPEAAWGERERYYVSGSIGEHRFRGCLDPYGQRATMTATLFRL